MVPEFAGTEYKTPLEKEKRGGEKVMRRRKGGNIEMRGLRDREGKREERAGKHISQLYFTRHLTLREVRLG